MPAPVPGKRGPRTTLDDHALLAEVHGVLDASPFVGEGYRTVWARLRQQRGIRTSMRRVRRTGEVKIGDGMSFVTNALAGELVGLEELLDGIWRLSYRRSALCFLDLWSGAPRVIAEPEAKDLLEEAEG